MNLTQLYNTVKYLKAKQILYRIYYVLRNKYRKKVGFKYPFYKDYRSYLLTFDEYILTDNKYIPSKKFVFLNKEKEFDNIDWNYKDFGKLWTYNLNYFDFLKQKEISKEEGLNLIKDFLLKLDTIKDGLEPYPISLRGINWIKFLSKRNIKDKSIDNSLYAQYYILMDNLEYHLLGNHLLENGFSLLFGAYYFRDEKLYKKAKEILTKELEEQILSDGAHFELSPMYHQILLDRLLDSINLIKNNDWKNFELLDFLTEKAQLMLSWLDNLTFSNGNIPMLNDSTFGIAPTTPELKEYTKRLGMEYKQKPLGESGYRKIKKERYEIVVDIADVKASYIPGHTHADTFTFELYIDGKPFIVDTGVSTYENNERRLYERSTKAHNTVEIENTSSSEIWGSFRLGERAKIVFLEDNNDYYVKATHDGYKKFGILHTREWKFEKDKILIKDTLNKEALAIARLHFHPNITEKDIMDKFKIQNSKFKIQNYKYASGYNKTISAFVMELPFEKELGVEIII